MSDQNLQEKNTLYAPAFSNDWSEQSLYPLADWLNGMAFKDFEFAPKGKPVIKIAEIKNGISGQTRFTNEEYDNKYLLKKGDMLFCWSGQPQTSIDIFWWDGPEGWLNQHIFKVTSKLENKYFFFYLLKYLKPNFVQIAINKQTTGLGHVTKGDLERFVVKLPKPEEQRAISAVLSSLDDKIELLRQQNKTLEATTQTIFKEWFVNFNFPGTTGKMIDSELGKIPEGWRVGKLGEFIDVRGGLSYDGNLISKTGTPMITMGFVSGEKRYEESGIKYYSGQYGQQHQIKANSLVIATRDVTQDRKLIGSPALIPNYFGNITIIAATNLYIVQNINSLPNRFLYWVMRTPEYRERIIGACKGTTIVMITKDSILDYEFVIPKKELVEKFSAINESIFNRLELIDNQIQTLSTLRDTLLPKLMKGEVRVEGFKK